MTPEQEKLLERAQNYIIDVGYDYIYKLSLPPRNGNWVGYHLIGDLMVELKKALADAPVKPKKPKVKRKRNVKKVR